MSFSNEYKRRVIEAAKTTWHYDSLIRRCGPDAFGNKPHRQTVRLWLQDAGVTLGQDAEETAPLSLVEEIQLRVERAWLDVIDPDLYAKAINPSLRNLWGRLYLRGTETPWLIYRMWKAGSNGERMYRVVPDRAEPFTIWAKSVDEFAFKARAHGLNIEINLFTGVAA